MSPVGASVGEDIKDRLGGGDRKSATGGDRGGCATTAAAPAGDRPCLSACVDVRASDDRPAEPPPGQRCGDDQISRGHRASFRKRGAVVRNVENTLPRNQIPSTLKMPPGFIAFSRRVQEAGSTPSPEGEGGWRSEPGEGIGEPDGCPNAMTSIGRLPPTSL